VIEIRPPADVFERAEQGVEGLLERWLVDEGDAVSAEQPVADAVLVKASFQVPAPCDGRVERIVVPQGDTFGVSAVLATLEPG
jgi:pyruvate/2-oxoglutarate dehydrogenase complex dihydrolipoamide acyltransferase (E2) component